MYVPPTRPGVHFHVTAYSGEASIDQPLEGFLPALAEAKRLVREALPAGGRVVIDAAPPEESLACVYVVSAADGAPISVVALGAPCTHTHSDGEEALALAAA